MALIACPECGREISNQAESCPGCGYPISQGVVERPETDQAVLLPEHPPALICPACKRPVGAEDRICRYCGVPNQNFIEDTPAAPADDEPIRCPHCGSAQIQAIPKGFSVGRAIAGAALTGSPLGAAAGAIGAGKIRRACLKCGKEF